MQPFKSLGTILISSLVHIFILSDANWKKKEIESKGVNLVKRIYEILRHSIQFSLWKIYMRGVFIQIETKLSS